VYGFVESSVPLWWGVLQFFSVLFLCSPTINRINRIVAHLSNSLQGYYRLIRLVDSTSFSGQQLQELQTRLNGAETSFHELEGFLKGLDSRGNIFGLIVFNILFLSDFFLIRRFYRWQRKFSCNMKDWLAVVSELDSLVSMATVRFNHPEAVNAEVVDDTKIIYRAQGLYHPFLGKNARKNDFDIEDHHYYIITGANMAGKSTFLRALGVNYILAINGMPVFADQLKVSRFKLFSSMRTQDDLAHGISYFNAELLRLKQLIVYADDEKPTLIILDEILKGTNSADKLSGSRMFLQAMMTQNVSGVIATHDLELSKMADEYPERFHNYCFEIQVGEQVTYDYQITSGVARNQNATYLLQKILDGCCKNN
jgi:DNA mismatch repair ATPase MutS